MKKDKIIEKIKQEENVAMEGFGVYLDKRLQSSLVGHELAIDLQKACNSGSNPGGRIY